MRHRPEPDHPRRCPSIARRDTLARNARAIKASVEPSAFEDPTEHRP